MRISAWVSSCSFIASAGDLPNRAPKEARYAAQGPVAGFGEGPGLPVASGADRRGQILKLGVAQLLDTPGCGGTELLLEGPDRLAAHVAGHSAREERREPPLRKLAG